MIPQIGLSTAPMVVAARARAGAGQRALRLNGGYVLLEPAAGHLSAVLERVADRWHGFHVTVVLDTPRAFIERIESELCRAAQAFDRIVLCGCEEAASMDTAMRLKRSIHHSAGRADCRLVAEPRRALRHCIDGMIPGDVVAWCCDAQSGALQILDEYGAIVVDDLREDGLNACVGTTVAPYGTAGASAHAQHL